MPVGHLEKGEIIAFRLSCYFYRTGESGRLSPVFGWALGLRNATFLALGVVGARDPPTTFFQKGSGFEWGRVKNGDGLICETSVPACLQAE